MYKQKKDNNQFKNNKQPELPENETAWNSNNQGVKHSPRPVGEVEMGDGQLDREDKEVNHAGEKDRADWLNGKLKTQN